MLQIMIIFSLVAGIDKLLNNKYGLGVKFEEGFKAMGGLALTIIGIYSLSPIIAKGLIPILDPLAKLLNTDPSVFISSLLATDLGAYNTSVEVANNPLIGNFNGLILGSMLGATISFTIPIAINLIDANDFPFFAKGILSGIVTVPAGMIVSGLLMKVPAKDIFFNIIPVVLISFIIAWGLMKAQDRTVQIFNILGKLILGISTFGLLISILQSAFGIKLIDGLIPIEESAILVLNISIVLSGAYPLLYFVSRKLHKYLHRLSDKYDMDTYSILGLISSLASCLPMLGVYDKMNKKGKILNAAFAVSGAFTFGGQLGYISSVAPEFVNPFIMGKLTAGMSAILLGLVLIKFEKNPGGSKCECK